MPPRAGRLDALATAIARACADRDVRLQSEEIPYGRKFTLAQGAATGVLSVYTTGKVVPNPKAAEHFGDILDAIAPLTAPLASPRATTKVGSAKGVAAKPGAGPGSVPFPCLGSDESGKGDYFGPLAVAAVLVADEREAELLRELGVRDSKLLAGPGQARTLARQVREVCAGRFAEVVVEPERYNQRVGELKLEARNSNSLLAWAHVEAYAPLVPQGAALAVADKFGSAHYLEDELRRRGLRVPLRQETGGERYTAVAAASILARDRCLEWFEQAEAEVGERLPRGAFDPGIIVVARRLHQRGGVPLLGRFAKLHFRTTLQVVR